MVVFPLLLPRADMAPPAATGSGPAAAGASGHPPPPATHRWRAAPIAGCSSQAGAGTRGQPCCRRGWALHGEKLPGMARVVRGVASVGLTSHRPWIPREMAREPRCRVYWMPILMIFLFFRYLIWDIESLASGT